MVSRTGRPRAITRHTLEEAAGELFLEQGYPHTSIDDIAARAGISRATFFNYFSQKSDLLFVAIDEALDALEHKLQAGEQVAAAIDSIAATMTKSRLPLALWQAEAMGALDDVREAAPARFCRLRDILAGSITDEVWRWAIAGAIYQAAKVWLAERDSDLSVSELLNSQLRLLHNPPTQLDAYFVVYNRDTA